MNLNAMQVSPSLDRNSAASDVAQLRSARPSWPDRPTLRLKELLRVVGVSRSKAYELMKVDPGFPKGIPLYDGNNSPKFYWTHEAIAWVEGRWNRVQARQGGR